MVGANSTDGRSSASMSPSLPIQSEATAASKSSAPRQQGGRIFTPHVFVRLKALSEVKNTRLRTVSYEYFSGERLETIRLVETQLWRMYEQTGRPSAQNIVSVVCEWTSGPKDQMSGPNEWTNERTNGPNE